MTYSWTGPAGFSSTQQDLINLSPGTYTLLVSSGTGCTISRTFEIGNCYDEEWETDPGTGVFYPAIVGLNFEPVKIGINGIIQSTPNANDGSAQVNLLAGTPPLYYHWKGDHGVESSTAIMSVRALFFLLVKNPV